MNYWSVLSFVLNFAVYGDILYISDGENGNIDCKFDGAEQLLRIATNQQLLFIKMKGEIAKEIAPNEHPWKLLNTNRKRVFAFIQ